MSDDLAALSLWDVAALIRDRAVSPVDVLHAVLDRTRRLAPALNCFITVTEELALSRAKELEAELVRRGPRGALHGIPVSLKDNICTAGVRTTAGSRVLASYVPRRDATVVERLRDAGAIVFAKASLFAFASGDVHPDYPPCRNPWDLARYAGGSSSGSAVSVAAGLGYASVGTDSGGSIRIPSAFCGVVGVRPSDGRVGRTGVIPFSYSLDSVGPITRTVRDAATVLTAVAGWDAQDLLSDRNAAEDFVAPIDADVKGLRVGLALPGPRETVASDIVAAIEHVALLLGERGVTVVPVAPPDYELAQSVKDVIFMAEASEYHHAWFRRAPERYHEPLRSILEDAEFLPASVYVRAQRIRSALRSDMLEMLGDLDALVAPLVGVHAPATLRTMEIPDASATLPLISRHTSLASVVGLASIAAPVRLSSDGMPLAYQLLGRPGMESVTLRLANAVEQASRWTSHRPHAIDASMAG